MGETVNKRARPRRGRAQCFPNRLAVYKNTLWYYK